MRLLNIQIINKNDLITYNKQVKLNINNADTYFISKSISVLNYVFQKFVFPASQKVMKRL